MNYIFIYNNFFNFNLKNFWKKENKTRMLLSCKNNYIIILIKLYSFNIYLGKFFNTIYYNLLLKYYPYRIENMIK